MMSSIVSAWRRLELWLWARFFILLIVLGAGTRRRRMSHNNGIAGRGTIRIVDHPEFPPTDFFEAGRAFPCRLRHASVAYMDDAMRAVRSASLKFADADFASPLDIQMNTGDFCFFWNGPSWLISVALTEVPAIRGSTRHDPPARRPSPGSASARPLARP